MAVVPKNTPLGVMYIEVNNTNFLNAGCYTLSNGQQQLFDIAIIFAGNINYDTSTRKAVFYANQQTARVLSGANIYIKPLQQKGIKVLLSILGNHQGAGVCNFETQESARDFAIILAGLVTQFDLDGIDFDDEYSDYGNNGTGQPNPYSFIYLLRELRGLIPNKIISFYYYGPAASRLSYNGLIAGDYLDYSWNAIYGTWIVPNVPGLNKNQVSPSAVNVVQTSTTTAQTLATRTIDEGYGVYLYYNLPNTNLNTYLSNISQRLYGITTTLANGCLQSWPPAEEETNSENIPVFGPRRSLRGHPRPYNN